MIIELRNVSDRNKGAELMLHSMIEHYAGRDDVTLCANHRVASGAARRALGLRGLVYHHTDTRYLSLPAATVPRWLRDSLDVVHPTDVDLVLDGAGFAYGDTWGPERLQNALRYYGHVKAHGGRVVLMPQSFGPFDDPQVRALASELFELVDLVFPRDDTAAACVRALTGDVAKVMQSPDFTPLLKPADTSDVTLPERPAAIIPNKKMIQKTDVTTEGYVAFVAAVAESFSAAGLSPFVLPHAVEDQKLVAQLRPLLPAAIPVVIEHDARRLKGLIGRCEAVFCSRFHGVMSALSQAVPLLATGWSHKYRHALAEYGVPDALVEPDIDAEALRSRVAALLEPDTYRRTVDILSERADHNRELSRQMWAQVDALTEQAA